MEVFFPTLESKITALVVDLRYIVFAIMVVGLVVYAASPRTTGVALLAPLAKAILIVAAIASMDQWFPRLDTASLQLSDYIVPGYSQNPTAAADTVRSATTQDSQGQGWSWRRLNESIYRAVTNALAHVFVYIGTLLTVPMLILQYVLRWLLYLLTPFALALILVPGFSGISIRFFQQVLAIHAWPIGFATTNMIAMSIWQEFRNAVGANPQNVTQAAYSPLFTLVGAILATVTIILGMIATPIVMQMLFSQGHAFTGSSANPATIFRTATNAVYSTRMLRGRAVAMPAAAPVSEQKAAATSAPPSVSALNRPGI